MMRLTLQRQQSTYLLLSLAHLVSPVWVLSWLKQCYSFSLSHRDSKVPVQIDTVRRENLPVERAPLTAAWAALELLLSVYFFKSPGLLIALFGSCSLAVLKTGHLCMV